MSQVILIDEVAGRLGVSPQWARKIAEENGAEMGAFRLTEGGRWRFREEDFERWRSGLGPKEVYVDVRTKRVSNR